MSVFRWLVCFSCGHKFEWQKARIEVAVDHNTLTGLDRSDNKSHKTQCPECGIFETDEDDEQHFISYSTPKS